MVYAILINDKLYSIGSMVVFYDDEDKQKAIKDAKFLKTFRHKYDKVEVGKIQIVDKQEVEIDS